jgi:hypothetical protein
MEEVDRRVPADSLIPAGVFIPPRREILGQPTVRQ